MKDMGPARQIMGMHIIQDQTKKPLYVTKVLLRFDVESSKLVGSSLPMNCKLSKDQCPK